MSHSVDALLCDIGGVLYVGDRPIVGAVEAVARLKAHYSVRFLTNTTQKPAAQIVAKLQAMGFDIAPEEVFTALDMTKMLLQREAATASLLLTDEGAAFFDDLPDAPRRYVVVGDAQENFDYRRLNAAFRTLMAGGELLAAAKNRCFKDDDGERSMDAGGFVAALEYASGKTARIIGKPSVDFYRFACDALGVIPERTVMIGDDIESDILGAQEAGIRAALVCTGKFVPADLERGITPDYRFDSIADVTF
jgi:HAD superfamily hydrolase (TIGR01458 family)